MNKNRVAPILGIDRLRMGTDGNGITTLVAFYGCPLKCKYCLNPKCHKNISDIVFSSSLELYDIVSKDELYYHATGGGVTFGGGEPLLYSDFIIDVLKLGANRWNVTIETSLNVPFNKIDILLPHINELIVDIKDINPKIYELYTKSSNIKVINNLKKLSIIGCTKKMKIRIPLISGFNNNIDNQKSISYLESLGYSNFDLFDYKTKF